MKRQTLLVVMLPLLMLSIDAVGGFYKCTIRGGIVYQEKPCPKGTGGAFELAPITSMSGTNWDKPRTQAGNKAALAGKKTSPLSTPGAANPPAKYDGGDRWHADILGYRAAVAESTRTGAPLFIYFYTDWCPTCRDYSAHMWPDPTVRDRLRGFVKVKLNPEHGVAEEALFHQLGGRGYPLILGGNGTDKPRPFRLYASADQWVSELDKLLLARR